LTVQPAPIGEARKAAGGDYDVIEQRNPEKVAGPGEAAGHLAILAARRGIAAGVVMNHQDRGGRLPQCRGKDFPGVDEALVEAASTHLDPAQEAVAAIEEEDLEHLLTEPPKLRREMSVNVSRGADGSSKLQRRSGDPAPHLESGPERSELCRADPGNGQKLGVSGFG
jgi:hypothetical protein